MLARAALRPVDALCDLGRRLAFHTRALGWSWRVALRYKTEVARSLAEISMGTGGLAVVGGSVVIVSFLTFFSGTEVGLQGFNALDQLGAAAFTGFVAAYFNTREVAPIISAIALSATVGCGFTAQLGAMRISEEIDALDVMAVPPLPFLVTTRVLAGVLAIVPLYLAGLLSSFVSTRLIVTVLFGQSAGTYDHYFTLFLLRGDVLWSFGKTVVFAVMIIMIHCYHGYHASGGPAGVGLAVGRAVRAGLVAVIICDLLLSTAIWGSTMTVRIAG
ncbi:ABC transporter permease [Actinomadura sp. 9N407]|uniref:ABC transporter permease n=1 Tax=Actinomadura sp. 9N407 TaxID=3375154 RepID=UPI0037AD163A